MSLWWSVESNECDQESKLSERGNEKKITVLIDKLIVTDASWRTIDNKIDCSVGDKIESGD